MSNATTLTVPGVHGALIQRLMPDWLKHGTARDLERLGKHLTPPQNTTAGNASWFSSAADSERQALADYQARGRRSAHALADLLKDFKGITAFAEPLLQAQLKAQLQLEAPVNSAEFVQIQRESVLFGALLRLTPHRQSLLQAALQNFAAGATFEAGSALAPQDSFSMELAPGSAAAAPRFRFRYDSTYDVTAQQFAQCCHELDLGGQYQQHLSAQFEAPATHQAVRDQSIKVYQDQLRVQAQLAFMQGDIGAAARQMLLSLAAGEPAPLFNGQPVRVSQLELFDASLAEVLLISADRDTSRKVEPVLLYLPGAPAHSLKEYPSLYAARQALHANLRTPAYQALLRRYLPHAEAARVLAAVKRELFHDVDRGDGVYQTVPNPNPRLNLRESAVHGELFAFLHNSCVAKLKTDARVLAVPSAEADEQARDARLAEWQALGLNVLNAAAFVVPGLGEVMAAVTAVQLVNEVIDAAHAWEEGDVTAVWQHLESVGANVALMAGLGVVGRAAVPMVRSARVDELVRVRLPSGEERLWQPLLHAYTVDVDLSQVTPDGQGLYTLGDQRYIRIEGRSHAVFQDEAGGWRIRAENPAAYQPELHSNGQGAWRLQAENPLRWHGLHLWRRLGHVVDGLSDEALLQLAAATGTRDDCLRRVLFDNTPLPALLDDSLVRWRAHQRVTDLLPRLRQGQALPVAAQHVPLALLTRMPGWPEGVVLQVLEPGEPLLRYGTGLGPDSRLLTLGSEQLGNDDYFAQVLETLSEQEHKALIGPYLDSAGPARLQQLREALADFAGRHAGVLLERLYDSENIAESLAMAPLQRDFPGLPQRLCRSLSEQANSAEWQQLTAPPGKVPLRLAEQARWLLEQVRLNRGLEALYLGVADTADSRRLALGALERLPGWSAGVRLEVRERSSAGVLLDSVGDAQASECKYLIRQGNGYQTLDAEGNELGPRQGLYTAILQALPDSERGAMQLRIDQPEVLRLRLAAEAAQQPDTARADLKLRARKAWFKPPLRLDDGRLGYPLSGRGASTVRTPPAVLERLQALYPQMTALEADGYLGEQGATDALQLSFVLGKEQELQALRQTLQEWVASFQSEQVSADHVRLVSPQTRQRVVEAIERCWRRQSERVHAHNGQFVGYKLDLSGQRLITLPVLNGDFSHVAALHLDSMGLRDVPQHFVGAFSGLRWLSLKRNYLTQLPEAIGELGGLTKLYLQDNTLALDAEACARLAGLRQLKILQLDGNPLGLLPDLSVFADLRGLMLRRTGLDTWPAGVFSLAELELLDLRENRIVNIPEHVLEPAAEQQAEVQRINRITRLHGNPLSADSLLRLTRYRLRSGLSLGIEPALRGAHATTGLSPAEVSASWLIGEPQAQLASSQSLWLSVLAEPGSESFFQLLSDLRQSADFKRAYPDLKERVWSLLKAAQADSSLRESLFDAAAHPHTCSDGVALVFSQLEVLALVREALSSASGVGAERDLMALAQGLFRLEQVERIALEDIAARHAAGLRVDEVEVRLGYRARLASTLSLPGQPSHMQFAPLAGISDAQVEAARVRVLASETPAALKAAIVERDFWITYLKAQYGEQFEALNKPYYARIEALEVDKNETGMKDQLFRQRIETIEKRRQVAEQRLLETLTADIWNNVPGWAPLG